MTNPLKQGLKPPVDGSRAGLAFVVMTNPLKQGLKLAATTLSLQYDTS